MQWNEAAAMVIRLLRERAACGEQQVTSNGGEQRNLGESDSDDRILEHHELFVAMLEMVVGRPLERNPSNGAVLSRDEAALLAVLRHAQTAGPIHTSVTVPHGLPEPLRWAAMNLSRALGLRGDQGPSDIIAARCPFSSPIQKVA